MYSYIFKKRVYDETHVVVQGESPIHFEDQEILIFRYASDEAYVVENVILATSAKFPGLFVLLVGPACCGDVVWADGKVGFPDEAKLKCIGYLVDRIGPDGKRKRVPHPRKTKNWEERDEALAETMVTLMVG